MKIYATDEFELWKETNYRIQFNNKSKSLLKSISKIIVGSIVSDEYKSMTFKAESIMPFFESRDEMDAFGFVFFLSKQLEYLIKEGKCFYKLNPDNIFIIDSKIVYLSNEYLTDINDNKVVIKYPFPKNELFDSPEILGLNTLPAEIHYKAVYYCLASIVSYFFREKLKYENLELLEGTKLGGFLKRCLHAVPEKRAILFI